MNMYDVTFEDGTTERRVLMFMGDVPSGFKIMKRLEQICGRQDIVKIVRPLVKKTVWRKKK